VAANVLTHGTGAINVDGGRVPSGKDHADKCASVVGLASNRNGAAYSEWTGERADSHSPLGRWPANLIHDGSDEVTGLFPQSTGQGHTPGKRGPGGISCNGHGGQNLIDEKHHDTGSAARFFYCAKASKADRSEGNTHPTVKPTALMRYLCRLVTPPGGVVLDPFTGSGSTGKGAILEGFRFVGIEREADYLEIAVARIKAVSDKPKQQEMF
jgi:hypothetical protein